MLLRRQLDLLLYQPLTDCFGSRVSDDRDDDGRLTTGQIVGIVVAAVIVCAVVVIVVAVIVYARRRGCVTRRQPTPTAAAA